MGSPFHGEAAISPRSGYARRGSRARCIVTPARDDRAADICRHPAERFARKRFLLARRSVAIICSAKRCSRWRVKCGETAWANGLGSRSRWSRVASAGPRRRSRAISPATPIRSRLRSCAGRIGFCCVLPAALLLKARWPQQRDLPAVAALGFCFFGVFFVLYNIAMSYTTAARASLALATLPLHTMVVGALLGIEPLTKRKSIGVCIAVLGVAAALATGLSAAPPGAWRGELIMTGGRVVHGVLQCLVSPVHPAIERAWLPYGRHGDRRRGADPGRRVDREASRH